LFISIDGCIIVDPDITPLMRAAASAGSFSRFYTLLEDGAEVNAHDQRGIIALMVASFSYNAQAVAMRISRGAQVMPKTSGKTAFALCGGE